MSDYCCMLILFCSHYRIIYPFMRCLILEQLIVERMTVEVYYFLLGSRPKVHYTTHNYIRTVDTFHTQLFIMEVIKCAGPVVEGSYCSAQSFICILQHLSSVLFPGFLWKRSRAFVNCARPWLVPESDTDFRLTKLVARFSIFPPTNLVLNGLKTFNNHFN